MKEWRSQLKRWGCIFICLYSCTIHLEVATSLLTDAFINVLRQFVSLRGSVCRLRCDKGTTLLERTMNSLQLSMRLTKKEWEETLLKNTVNVFNPADAGHMGGVWECPTRTVRNILASLFHRVGFNSIPELELSFNSNSNSGIGIEIIWIGIELELILLRIGGIGIGIILNWNWNWNF